MPYLQQWEESTVIPESLYTAAANDGILMPLASGSSIKKEWAGKYPIIGDVKPEEWDGFHDFIMHDEMTRVGGIGYVWRTPTQEQRADHPLNSVPNGLIGGVVIYPCECSSLE